MSIQSPKAPQGCRACGDGVPARSSPGSTDGGSATARVRWSALLATLVCLAGGGPSSGAAQPPLHLPPRKSESTGAHHAQQVSEESFDFARLNLSWICPASGSVWVVARVLPAPYSGALFLENGYLDVETHRFVMGPGEREVIRIHGRLDVCARLTGAAGEEQYLYRWEEPFRGGFHFRLPPPAQYDYRPYAAANESAPSSELVLCRINLGADGAERFRPTYLIPATWAGFAAPAVDFVRDHRALFDPHGVRNEQAPLLALVEVDNPLTAINAFRFLEANGAMPPSLAQSALEKSRGVEQAAFALLMLGAHPGRNAQVTDSLAAVIRKARSAGEVAGLAAVLGPACLRSVGARDALNLMRLMQLLHTSAQSWATGDPAATELETILDSLGFGNTAGHDTGPAELKRLEQFVKATTPMVVSTGNQR